MFAVLKIILAIAATIIAFFVMMVAVGALLKKRTIRTVSGFIPFAPVQVWRAILDVESSPQFMKGLASVEVIDKKPGGTFIWREHYKGKKMSPITYDTTEMIAEEKINWRIIDDGGLGFAGEWRIELTAQNSGTMVSIRQTNEVRSPVLRFLSLFMNKSAKINSYLTGLTKYLKEK